MGDDGNVIDLPVGDARREQNLRESEFAELPIGSRRGYSLDACKHARSIVDARARTVTCSSCGVGLDAIDVLRRVQEAKRRIGELQASIRELERVERNAKSRVRTARKRALVLDLDAVDAAMRVRYSAERLGTRHFDTWTDGEKAHARGTVIEIVEAYIGVLTEGVAALAGDSDA